MLLAKLVLAPALVGLASWVERRWGHRTGGWVAGFPIVAGPVLLFYALEQGPGFAARAASLTLLGLVSLSGFCLAYGWASLAGPPLVALPLGWAAFAALTALLAVVEQGPAVHLAAGAGALALSRRLLPPAARPRPAGPASAAMLAARMAAAALLVVALTGLARAVGPRLSGLLTPFPVAATVLVVAAHRAGGACAAGGVLRGLLAGLFGFAAFCFLLALALPAWGVAAAFGLALGACLAVQLVVLRLL